MTDDNVTAIDALPGDADAAISPDVTGRPVSAGRGGGRMIRIGKPWIAITCIPGYHHDEDIVIVYFLGGRWSLRFATQSLYVDNVGSAVAEAWKQATLFVALAKLGQIFGLLAELRYWAAVDALPPPLYRLGLTPLSGVDVWRACDACDGYGNECADCHECWPCETCDGEGKTGEPTRVDDAIAVLDDWRQEHGETWAAVMPRLTVLGYKCDRRDHDCSGVAEPRCLFCAKCIESLVRAEYGICVGW